MKLELLDAYNIRARLSASIILLAPIAVTLFFLFEEVRAFATSSVILFVLLALTNCVPILQRTFGKHKTPRTNYAAQLLYVDDKTISAEMKKRYYAKLLKLEPSFACFEKPEESPEFKSACESAVAYLRSRTRDNHLVQEENINYGLCRNLLSSKTAGIIISALCMVFTAIFSFLKYDALSAISTQNYLAFTMDALLLLFWIAFVTKKAQELSGIAYAKALIASIDSLS